MRRISLLLNYLDDSKAVDPKTGKLIIAPTDSRFRSDQRQFEFGQQDDADKEKLRLEIKQREARKLLEESG